MISALNPSQNPLIQNQSSHLKSTATVTSNPPAQKDNKLPPNAKVVGNYLLGKYYETEEKTLDKAHLEKFIWPCIFQQRKRWR